MKEQKHSQSYGNEGKLKKKLNAVALKSVKNYLVHLECVEH